QCTIMNNRATGGGGGGVINNNLGSASIAASTISANSADGQRGGGIANSGTMDLANNTISGKNADTGARIAHRGILTYIPKNTITGKTGGLAAGVCNGGIFSMQNSILAGNLASARPDCDGEIGSRGYNLLGINSVIQGGGSCLASPGAGDIVGTPANP